jgi:hypothetical protein
MMLLLSQGSALGPLLGDLFLEVRQLAKVDTLQGGLHGGDGDLVAAVVVTLAALAASAAVRAAVLAALARETAAGRSPRGVVERGFVGARRVRRPLDGPDGILHELRAPDGLEDEELRFGECQKFVTLVLLSFTSLLRFPAPVPWVDLM